MENAHSIKEYSTLLLQWYDDNGRILPWRVKGQAHSCPYKVWVSEIMLQQTTVKVVVTYFDRFLKQFPDIFSLANASIDEVLLLWQGLGYYTRAKKMHECAQKLVAQYNGTFPCDRQALLKLPGIGPYTSASIMAFAFNKPEAVVDGNVIRVLCRLKGWTQNTSLLMPQINQLALEMTPRTHSADYANAIMDLGATVCTPKKPVCLSCPWQKSCNAYKQGIVHQIPLTTKISKATKKGFVFLIKNNNGQIFIRKRTQKGLLSGLYEFPWNTDETLLFNAQWVVSNKSIKHVFTHFTLHLKLLHTPLESVPENINGQFVNITDLPQYAFSTLMKKISRWL